MLKISKLQMAKLDSEVDAAYARDVARYMRAEHEEATAGLSDAELLRRVEIGIERAKGYGMTWDATITGFVAIMFEVAPTFDEQPAIRDVLLDGRIPADVRIDALWDRTTEEDWDEAEQRAADAESFWARAGAVTH